MESNGWEIMLSEKNNDLNALVTDNLYFVQELKVPIKMAVNEICLKA